ncbi:MAG TPA: DNA polymerase III subunit delta [Clostridiales bacterium]|nr:DNA polymerase III subunit delta [Clostridiales bacterium]
MKIIKEHIKLGEFKAVYLLYGSEDYLKKLYRDKLTTAIIGDKSSMNYSYYEGNDLNLVSITELVNTLPFFNNKRLVIIENSKLFKNQNEFNGVLKEMSDSTIVVFIEAEVDKRNKLYKFVKDKGTISEMNGMDEGNLKLFVASLLEQAGKKITANTVSYFIDKTGSDMINIQNEVEKLIGYTMDRNMVSIEDIDAVVTTQITGKIFHLIDAIGSKNQKTALDLYYDLLSVREKPMSILFLIIRHFNILLQVKSLTTKGSAKSEIAEKVGIPPFTVNKYQGQGRNFTSKGLVFAIEYATDIEEKVKSGLMVDQIGVEILIIRASKGM